MPSYQGHAPDVSPSRSSLMLTPISETGVTLATATGFLVIRPEGPALVTNRHVVTGKHNESHELLDDKNGALPHQLRIRHRTDSGETVHVEPLFDMDEMALWLEDPVHGGSVDAVILPLTGSNMRIAPYDLGNLWPAQSRNVADEPSVTVSDSVFVVGFPFGLSGDGYEAIWVRGTIATDPEQDYGSLPRFLVDSRTRRGQSGSPVIFYQRYGGWLNKNNQLVTTISPVEVLMGVYSGRVNEESDLGFVWNKDVIKRIVDHGQRPHVDNHHNPVEPPRATSNLL